MSSADTHEVTLRVGCASRFERGGIHRGELRVVAASRSDSRGGNCFSSQRAYPRAMYMYQFIDSAFEWLHLETCICASYLQTANVLSASQSQNLWSCKLCTNDLHVHDCLNIALCECNSPAQGRQSSHSARKQPSAFSSQEVEYHITHTTLTNITTS